MKKGLEIKVGLFVLIGLALAALMVVRFSKGTGLSSTYGLNLKAVNAGGIIRGAAVLMAGVPVGSVSEIRLAPDGSSVTIMASIYDRFRISSNAVFSIDTVGFLGDRYISVSPGPAPKGEEAGYLEPGDTVMVQQPFDFAEVAESANSLMARLSGTVGELSNTVERINRSVLSDGSMSNLTETIANFRALSERSLAAVETVNVFVATNTPALTASIHDFGDFTEKLNLVTLQLQETLATNRTVVRDVFKNLETASMQVNQILGGVQEGKGLAGKLLSNEEMANYTSLMLSNFMVLSSNINNLGLWRVIRSPKS